MTASMSGRVVIVTGASSGIGEATAELLAQRGADVYAVGRDHARLVGVVDRIRAAGGTATAVEGDLRDASRAAAIAGEVAAAAGRIDGIVHAAGVYDPQPLAETTLERFDSQWNIHVRGPYALTQAALDHLSDGSTIVFVSSTVAHKGFAGCSAYTATKGAVESLARSLAVELAPKVRVNTVAPGFVLTPMVTSQIDAFPALQGMLEQRTPTGWVGQAPDLAEAIAFLCDPASRYVLGASLVVDGGWTAQAWQG